MCTSYLELFYTYNKLSGQVIYLVFRSSLEENQLNLKSLHPCCQLPAGWGPGVSLITWLVIPLVMAPAGLACRLWFLLISSTQTSRKPCPLFMQIDSANKMLA